MRTWTIKRLIEKAIDLLRINDPYTVHGPTIIRAKASSHRPREVKIRHDQFMVKR